MKRNLLTFLFVIAFICVGISVTSAKNTSSSANSVAVSKRLSVAKIKALNAKCGMQGLCSYELQNLVINNGTYEAACAAGGYQLGCAPVAELMLLQSAEEYETCLYFNSMFNKNIDKTKDRNKKQVPNG